MSEAYHKMSPEKAEKIRQAKHDYYVKNREKFIAQAIESQRRRWEADPAGMREKRRVWAADARARKLQHPVDQETINTVADGC